MEIVLWLFDLKLDGRVGSTISMMCILVPPSIDDYVLDNFPSQSPNRFNFTPSSGFQNVASKPSQTILYETALNYKGQIVNRQMSSLVE